MECASEPHLYQPPWAVGRPLRPVAPAAARSPSPPEGECEGPIYSAPSLRSVFSHRPLVGADQTQSGRWGYASARCLGLCVPGRRARAPIGPVHIGRCRSWITAAAVDLVDDAIGAGAEESPGSPEGPPTRLGFSLNGRKSDCDRHLAGMRSRPDGPEWNREVPLRSCHPVRSAGAPERFVVTVDTRWRRLSSASLPCTISDRRDLRVSSMASEVGAHHDHHRPAIAVMVTPCGDLIDHLESFALTSVVGSHANSNSDPSYR
jgi:hypothetical protein